MSHLDTYFPFLIPETIRLLEMKELVEIAF